MIQQGLKAPKGQYNSFGKYNYRSCEDILEAVKPLLEEQACVLTITDTIEHVEGRFYVKATATIFNSESKSVSVSAYAREQENKTGMDQAQLTGATSSYARKYALNGLFCIDDTKDADTMDNTNEGHSKVPAKQEDDRLWMTEKQLHVALERIKSGDLQVLDKAKASMKMKKDYREQLENAAHEYKVSHNLI